MLYEYSEKSESDMKKKKGEKTFGQGILCKLKIEHESPNKEIIKLFSWNHLLTPSCHL